MSSPVSTNRTNIPMLDLSAEVNELWDDLQHAIGRVLRSGQFIMGPDVKAFEDEVAAYLGVRHAIALNSGTDALVIGLRALGVGPGDEVITTPFTFFATAEAVTNVGAAPVFVDIDPHTYNIDPARIEEKITERTRAIIPVHLYGQGAEMDEIMGIARKYGLKVLEDVAQSMGASYKGKRLGTIGDAGALSFFPTKPLGAYGDGGMVLTNDDVVAEHCRMLRVHGARKKYFNEVAGYNSRLDTLQAAILRVKLPHLERWIAGRQRVARAYSEALAKLKGVTVPFEARERTHVYHQYTIRIHGSRRDTVQEALQREGIATMVYYPVPVHRLPLYAGTSPSLPVAEAVSQEVLSLPIWPQMSAGQIDRVVEALAQAVGRVDG